MTQLLAKQISQHLHSRFDLLNMYCTQLVPELELQKLTILFNLSTVWEHLKLIQKYQDLFS